MSLAEVSSPVQAESFEPTVADRDWWAAQQSDFADFDALVIPGEPLLPLADHVAIQASLYRSHETEAGDLIAATLDALAAEIRFMGQGAPIGVGEYRARKAAWEGWELEGGRA